MSEKKTLTLTRAACAAILCLLPLLLSSCGGGPPDILSVFHQINYVQDRALGKTYQALSLFLLPHDPDGYEDLDVIYLIHDGTELYWTIDSAAWQRVPSGDENWIGTASLCMPDGGALPRGRYRLLLKDLSGEHAERELYLSDPDPPPSGLRFPSLRRRAGRVHVDTEHASPQILLFDSGGLLVGRHPVPPEGLSLDLLLADSEVRAARMSFYIYTRDPEAGIGLVSGPYGP